MAGNRGARLKTLTARLVTGTRMLVLAAGAATALGMAAIVSLQLGFWLMTRRWSPFPISRLFELADITAPRAYLLASDNNQLRSHSLGEWLLDVPAIVVLFVALAVVAIVSTWLTSLERSLTGSRSGEQN